MQHDADDLPPHIVAGPWRGALRPPDGPTGPANGAAMDAPIGALTGASVGAPVGAPVGASVGAWVGAQAGDGRVDDPASAPASGGPVGALSGGAAFRPWQRRGIGGYGPRPLAGDALVQPLSVALVAVALLWMIFGGADGDPQDASQTAAVNPYNSIVWLGLLGAAMPVMRYRWLELTRLVRANWLLLLLFAYFAMSVSWALDPPASMRRVIATLVQFTVLASGVSGIRRAPVLHVTIAAVCIIAAAADLAALGIVPARAMTVEGLAGFQGQKNQTGLTMMYGCLAVAPCLAYARAWFSKTLLVAGLLLLLVVLVLTRSTTSEALTLAAVPVIPLFLRIGRLRRRLVLAIVAGFVFALLAALFLYVAWCAVSGADPLAPLTDVTFTNRLGIWTFMIDEIVKRPWLGAGYSSFWGIDPTLQPSLQTDQWFSLYEIITEGHQGYLDLWATTGIVGLIGGLTVVFGGIRLAARGLYRAPPASVAWFNGELGRPTAIFHFAFLLALLVHNFTESGLFGSGSLLTAGLLVTLLDLRKWQISRPR